MPYKNPEDKKRHARDYAKKLRLRKGNAAEDTNV
jgi:hypothetical protein